MKTKNVFKNLFITLIFAFSYINNKMGNNLRFLFQGRLSNKINK